MTVLSVLQSLIGTKVKVFQSKNDPDFFTGNVPKDLTEKFEEIQTTITSVKYIEPYGETELEGGGYFEAFFEEGSVILDNY
jgi:hypothetical protein